MPGLSADNRRHRRTQLLLLSWANATVGVAAVVAALTASTPASPTTLRSLTASPPAPVSGPPTAPATTVTTAVPEVRTAVAASPSAPSTVEPPATPVPVTEPPTTALPPPPLRVLVVGDSVGQNLTNGLAARARRAGDMVVHDLTTIGCPVSRGGAVRWPDQTVHPVPRPCAGRREAWPTVDAELDPDVVLLQSSILDVYDRQPPGWPDFVSPGDVSFDDWLATEQVAAIDELSAGGALVVWSSVPCARWDPVRFPNHFSDAEGNARIRHVNTVNRAALSAARPVAIADLDGVLCPAGQFESTVAGVSDARPDGVHLTDAAAEALAEAWLAPLLLSLR